MKRGRVWAVAMSLSSLQRIVKGVECVMARNLIGI
jgi:hypothetical protein